MGRRASWITIVLALLVACTVPVPFAEEWLFTTDREQLPTAADCERCHGAVYREWAESPHARAWRSRAFVRLTADHAAGDCLDCHAPAPLGPKGEITLRSDHQSEGVTCVTCHLSPQPHDGRLAMRGPHAATSPVEVHPVVEDPLFLKPELCGTCHEGILEQWTQSPAPADGFEKKTCQSCHMPSVRRKIETYDSTRPYSAVIVALGNEIEGRRHVFAIPDDPWDDIDVRLLTRERGAPLEVDVGNRLPHAIPAGTFGRRELRLRLSWPGGKAERVLRADLDEAIAAGSTRRFRFSELPEGVRGSIVLERRNPETGSFERMAPKPAKLGTRQDAS